MDTFWDVVAVVPNLKHDDVLLEIRHPETLRAMSGVFTRSEPFPLPWVRFPSDEVPEVQDGPHE